jgi:hypothetical protein
LERLVLVTGGMVRLRVALNASARSTHDLLEALRYLMVGTRLQTGCVECAAWTDPNSTVHYVEEWETEEDMRRRVMSDAFTSLLCVMECGQGAPAVHFDFVTETRGLDYIAEVRKAVG